MRQAHKGVVLNICKEMLFRIFARQQWKNLVLHGSAIFFPRIARFPEIERGILLNRLQYATTSVLVQYEELPSDRGYSAQLS